LSGEITSRDDVIRALDKVCAYYKRFEPSSPVPLLVQRARRLVKKEFVEIIQDLTPEALKQIELIGGSEQQE
jgi:type VI secretion system protein ImpA